VMAIGAPGDSNIITAVTHSILNYFLFYPGNLQQAVFAPRIHHQWLPDTVSMEVKGFSDETQKNLAAKGHTVTPYSSKALVIAVARDEKTGEFTAVFDPRDESGAKAQ